MRKVVFMYVQGEGVAEDFQKAMEWYLKAVENGSTDAMVFVAYLYEEGNGVEQDYKIAMEWYLKAAN